MNAQLITTIVTGLGIIGAIYTMINRSEDRLTKAMNTRFDDQKDLWRAELRRVEEVLDARLKHLEER